MEYLKLIKEILTVLSDTPLPTIIVLAGLVFLLHSFAAIKYKPFEVKARHKVLTTPLIIGIALVIAAILLNLFVPQAPPPGETITITPTETELVVSSPTAQSSTTTALIASTTLTSTPSPTIEPSPTPTETPPIPTPTSTPKVLFQENFLDNKHRWQLVSQPRGPQIPGIETNIYGGKFVVSVVCPAAYAASTCNVNVPVPYPAIKDFFIEFETSVKKRSEEANVIIGVQFRRTDASYYWFQYKEYGVFLFSLILKSKVLALSDEALSPSINTDIGSVNKIGLYAKGSQYIVFANGTELIEVEDGNINQDGRLFIKFHVARGNSATIEMDNLVIRDVQ